LFEVIFCFSCSNTSILINFLDHCPGTERALLEITSMARMLCRVRVNGRCYCFNRLIVYMYLILIYFWIVEINAFRQFLFQFFCKNSSPTKFHSLHLQISSNTSSHNCFIQTNHKK
jgi:hypothetical protein